MKYLSNMKSGLKALSVLLLVLSLGVALSAGPAAAKEKIVFVDWSWDSAQVHNRIAGFIVENGYGYEVEYMFADTIPGFHGLARGDIDVSMEMWVNNIKEIWEEALEKGQIIDLGQNFPDAPQGWYVPTYMVKGDPERGIEPVAPDLETVEDLKKYWHLFKDPEEPDKGRFYNAPTGWMAHTINNSKLEAYGLTDKFTSFAPGSQAALAASIVGAYRRGKPWVGYYWEPTAIMGELDMTMLKEPAYNEKDWNEDYSCAYPSSKVRVAINSSLKDRAPEVVEFLDNYQTTLKQTNRALAYFANEGNKSPEATGEWFLRTYEDVWTKWVPADVAAKVKAALR